MPKKETTTTTAAATTEMSGKVEKQDNARRHRGGRLARRARSFKEDLLERFTQMRSPSSARSASPNKASPRTKQKHEPLNAVPNCTTENPLRKNEKDIQQLQKQVGNALRYFQDVVDKDTLEMLPGSATVVLENILAIHTMCKNCFTNEQSSLMMSATNQVYQSLANLIRWADNVLLHGNQAQNKENVAEVVKAVQEATQILVHFLEEKLHSKGNGIHNGICGFKPESPKRTSLPDIPLTPREREILEQTSFSAADDSHLPRPAAMSSDNLLSNGGSDLNVSDPEPPPKPPLPTNWDSSWLHSKCPSAGNVLEVIPDLPPKRRLRTGAADSFGSFQHGSWNGNFSPLSSSPHANAMSFSQNSNEFASEWSKMITSPTMKTVPARMSSSDWTSPLSGSPTSASPLSASASSLDSVMNRSADDLLSAGTTLGTSIRMNMTMMDMQSKFSSESAFGSSSSASKIWSSPLNDSNAAEDFNQVHMKLQDYSCKSTVDSFYNETSSSGMYNTDTSGSSFSLQGGFTQSSSKWASLNTSVTVHSISKSEMCMASTEASWSSAEESAGVQLPTPPAIPPKKRSARKRTPSQYDNVPDLMIPSSADDVPSADSSSPTPVHFHFELSSLRHSESYQVFSKSSSDDGLPPPIPPKQKNIMAYVQTFGNYSEPNKGEFFRHSLHTYNLLQAQWQQKQSEMAMNLPSLETLHLNSEDVSFSDSTNVSFQQISVDESVSSPPALPPKRNKAGLGNGRARPSTSPTTPSPPMYELKDKSSSMIEGTNGFMEKNVTVVPVSSAITQETKVKSEVPMNPLDEIHVDDVLVHKKQGEEGPDIRGGSVDALIVRATKVNKNDFMYQEAFLTTFRTFITPIELVKKLVYRYNKFNIISDMLKQRAARNAFALLVRVVDDLCVNDIEESTLQTLMDFVFHLLCNGDLILARALRKKVLEKCEVKKKAGHGSVVLLSSFGVTTRQSVLLDFKSEHLAEQMTLLDADLFQKIEIPEVLIWAREQSEELSPNLTTFTEHFNKMSYWARSRILEQDDAKDREKYVVKFIKIMKHLRKLNNFNSYLAILSALDSAPIRRLEWQKHITEGLKEYCELIDSSSSFRAYRQALAETEPPCIPYIGLILQDLTFVHIGNSDLLPDGNVNFSKRWQQFNILDNMRRFKKCNYSFKRHDKIIAFFNNFDDYLCEEAMWQISESIKPRGGKKKISHS